MVTDYRDFRSQIPDLRSEISDFRSQSCCTIPAITNRRRSPKRSSSRPATWTCSAAWPPKLAEIAALPVHQEKARLWQKLNDLESERPMVWINEIPWHEMNVDGELTLRDRASLGAGPGAGPAAHALPVAAPAAAT